MRRQLLPGAIGAALHALDGGATDAAAEPREESA